MAGRPYVPGDHRVIRAAGAPGAIVRLVGPGQEILRLVVLLVGRLAVPLGRFRHVALDTQSAIVHRAQTVLRIRIAFLRRHARPFHGLPPSVLLLLEMQRRTVVTIVVHLADPVLRPRQAGLRRPQEPLHGVGPAPGDAGAPIILQPEPQLRLRQTGLGRLAIPAHGRGVILRQTGAMLMEHSELELGARMALPGQRPPQAAGAVVVALIIGQHGLLVAVICAVGRQIAADIDGAEDGKGGTRQQNAFHPQPHEGSDCDRDGRGAGLTISARAAGSGAMSRRSILFDPCRLLERRPLRKARSMRRGCQRRPRGIRGSGRAPHVERGTSESRAWPGAAMLMARAVTGLMPGRGGRLAGSLTSQARPSHASSWTKCQPRSIWPG